MITFGKMKLLQLYIFSYCYRLRMYIFYTNRTFNLVCETETCDYKGVQLTDSFVVPYNIVQNVAEIPCFLLVCSFTESSLSRVYQSVSQKTEIRLYFIINYRFEQAMLR